MKINYSLVSLGDYTTLSIFGNGDPLTIQSDHPHFDEIIALVIKHDESYVNLLDKSAAINQYFQLSDDIRVGNGALYFRNEVVSDHTIVEIILQRMEAELPVEHLVNFVHKLYTTASQHTIENLHRWMSSIGSKEFDIDSNGSIIAYKGLNEDYSSRHAGPGYVNGQYIEGNLDNSIGNVLSIDRRLVEFDPSIGCASGLHVGSKTYATEFSNGAIVRVSVEPADVISVPTDCNDQKMRVVGYKVIGNSSDFAENHFYAVQESEKNTDDYDEDNYDEDDIDDFYYEYFDDLG